MQGSRVILLVLSAAVIIGGGAFSQQRSAAGLDANCGKSTEEKLAIVLDVDYRSKRLTEIFDELQRKTELTIVVVQPAAVKEKLYDNRAVTYSARQQPVKEILRGLLWEIRMAYTIQDGIVVVTTEQEARGRLERRIYPVDELVNSKDSSKSVELLMILITNIDQSSWDTDGGAGHVEYYPLSRSLVITQRAETQEQIQAFLQRLRELKGNWERK
jgi:hypothetical protein